MSNLPAVVGSSHILPILYSFISSMAKSSLCHQLSFLSQNLIFHHKIIFLDKNLWVFTAKMAFSGQNILYHHQDGILNQFLEL